MIWTNTVAMLYLGKEGGTLSSSLFFRKLRSCALVQFLLAKRAALFFSRSLSLSFLFLSWQEAWF